MGQLDGTGFHRGEDYTARFKIGIKDGVERTFAGIEKITAKVNGNKATITKGSNTEITVEYTWKQVGGAAPATPESELKDKLASLAASFTATNGTDDKDVVAYLKNSLPTGTSIWKTGSPYVFKIKKATVTAAGWISMDIGVTVGGVTVDNFTFRQDIPVLTSEEAENKGFTDVPSNAYYASAVKWAVDKSITSGTSATTFSPSSTCTRAQILTFMWRAVGSPQSTITNPFTDIKQTDYFYGAALWAAKKGMVTGTKFEANTPCTRSSTVTYLWLNAEKPQASVTDKFTDVPKNADYATAVAWAVENGITGGTSETTFSPDTICDRGQIVTFLNRASTVVAKPAVQPSTTPVETEKPAETEKPVETEKPTETVKTDDTVKVTEPDKVVADNSNKTATDIAHEFLSKKEIAEYEEAVEKPLTEALGEDHGENYTDLQKVFMLHNYLSTSITYGSLPERGSDSALCALVDKHSACIGITEAYNDLLYRVGVEAKKVSGSTTEGPHTWSAVKLDGKWYHVDVTWDLSQDADYSYFLKSDNALKNHSDYSFHCTDKTYEKGYLFAYGNAQFYWNEEEKVYYYPDMSEVKTTDDLKVKLTAETTEFQPSASVVSDDWKYICFYKNNGATDQYPLYLYCIETNEYYKHLFTGISNAIGCKVRQTDNNIEVITPLYSGGKPVAPKIKATVSLPESTDSHTVTLDTNYTGGEVKECKYLNDDWATSSIFSNPPKRSGVTFDGWYTEKTGGTKIEKLSRLTDEQTVIYAHWK